MPQGFHPIGDIAHKVAVNANTRRFQGEGTLYLKVPGLRSLESVSCDGHTWPAKREVRYPVDLSDRRETMVLDMVHLTHLPDGTPVLLRSIVSNDGFWQAFANFDITGEWDEDVPAPEIPEPEPPKIRKGQR